MAARSSFLKFKKDLNVHAAVGKSSSTATGLLRARPLRLSKLMADFEANSVPWMRCYVLVPASPSALARFEFCCSFACGPEAEVLEDLERREVPVHLPVATVRAFRAPLELLLDLLDLVKELPQVAWVVGARHGSFVGPSLGSS
jgi:hypothetical protein